MNTDTGEIRRIENVTPEELKSQPWEELKPEEVEPLINTPQAERPAVLAAMRGIRHWYGKPELLKRGKQERRKREKNRRKHR